MATRGRGRGRPGMPSVNVEQLGLEKGEALPPPVLQPPPKYPPLEYKAPPFQPTMALACLWEAKRYFAEMMHESTSNIQPATEKKDIERYSDNYARSLETDQISWDQRYNWTMLPRELMPTAAAAKRKAKELRIAAKAKKLKEIDINKKLQELEQKEKSNDKDVDVDEENNKDDDDDDKDPDDNVDVLDETAEVDYEMDDETDYQNNYFDNGEEYGDEDDNIDDGPTF